MGLQGQVLIFVIPAKAGIQMIEAKFATRNQVQTEANGSLPPLWEKARMGARRAQARLSRAQIPALYAALRIPAFAGMTGGG